MKQKNDIVSFFRGIAIFTIVIYHLIQTINTDPIIQKVAAFGGAGVHIFILCSGFGLYLSYLQKPINYITFLKKRLSRIYYPYIIIVILMAIHSIFEIYLLHILIFSLMMTTSKYSYFVIVLCIPITYFISWGYSQLLKIIYNTQIIK